ncbi:hypothetical protein DUNSADRAFT_14577 [Dunaliella salina]|uniref:Uncharacterized protein n=1 Tax=Dunaliella salina TaxID=3046 RepID=A0ABQ7G754_DUNSA|nr:hypothetical protein DUNSADRAFT_14577 [Dunaliella salina]|eukprot:KAF5830439.1 hypothetical protein DUNSADRAFT_14577 [Dunaliella salina]
MALVNLTMHKGAALGNMYGSMQLPCAAAPSMSRGIRGSAGARRGGTISQGGCLLQQRGVDRSLIIPQADRRQQPEARVSYGQDWYEQTREAAKLRRSPREELQRRRLANRIANNGQERKDLFTNNWEGDQYKGSPVNILTVLVALLVLTPTAGLIFARFTYGTLWG